MLDMRSRPTVTFDGLNRTLSIHKKGSLQDISTAYFHKAALANILSFSQVRTHGHRISYDATEDSFTLHPISQSRTYVFQRHSNGLYVADMDQTSPLTGLVTTVKDNEALYPQRDVIKAKAVRQLQRRLANSPDAKLKRALSQRQITHSDVLPVDVTRATEICGPSLEALNAKIDAQLEFGC